MKIDTPKLKCQRCGHEWWPRKQDVTICPKCKSAYWAKPKGGVMSKAAKLKAMGLSYRPGLGWYDNDDYCIGANATDAIDFLQRQIDREDCPPDHMKNIIDLED